jgi:hypothetical protein
LALIVGALAVPSTALASGGVNSGGVNSGGVNSGGVNSGGSGGGSTTTATGPCAHITSFGNATGYYSVFAAIWTSYSISGTCTGPVNWTMTYTNEMTGSVERSRSGSFTGSGTGGTIDEDWAAFSTPYDVSLIVTDSAGRMLDSRGAVATTPAPKDGSAG